MCDITGEAPERIEEGALMASYSNSTSTGFVESPPPTAVPPEDPEINTVPSMEDLLRKPTINPPQHKSRDKDKQYTIAEFKKFVQEGMYVRYSYHDNNNNKNVFICGKIGETSADGFYIWQCRYSGAVGHRNPSLEGFIYSWGIQWNDTHASISIVDNDDIPKVGNWILHVGGEYSNQASKILYNDGQYLHLLRLDGLAGGGVRMSHNNKHAYLEYAGNIAYFIRLPNPPNSASKEILDAHVIEADIPKFKISDEVMLRDELTTTYVIRGIAYDGGVVRYLLTNQTIESDGIYYNQDAIIPVNKYKSNFMKTMRKAYLSTHIDPAPTPEQMKEFVCGALVEVRNDPTMVQIPNFPPYSLWSILEEDPIENIVTVTRYMDTYPSRGVSKNIFMLHTPSARYEPISLASSIVRLFNCYARAKTPVFLLGMNKKKIVDIAISITDERGCSDMATIFPEAYVMAVRTLNVSNRDICGYAILYPSRTKNSLYSSFLSTHVRELIRETFSNNTIYIVSEMGKLYVYTVEERKSILLPIRHTLNIISKREEVKKNAKEESST